MEVLLVEVNWALLFWIGLLLLNLIVAIIGAILESKVRKEIIRQNQIIMEQNRNLRTVIARVCSKSVRDRKDENKSKDETV